MARRSFAQEDRYLNTPSITTSRKRTYSDIDLLFRAKGNGDLYKKKDAAAVKQSVKNLIQTNYHEKPFNPFFGANIRNMLFELAGAPEDLVYSITEDIKNAIANFEPRAEVEDLQVNVRPDNSSISVTLTMNVRNTAESVVLSTSISRIR
jgi:phage baseplate assembly protein W